MTEATLESSLDVYKRQAVGNGCQDGPDLVLEGGAGEAQRRREVRNFPRKVNVQPLLGLPQYGEIFFLMLLFQIAVSYTHLEYS